MPAATFPLYAEQGATLRETVALKNPDGTIPNLTGCHAQMMIRASYPAAVALITLSDVNGGLVLGGAAGTIGIVVTAAATLSLPVNFTTLTPAQVQAANGAPPMQTYVYDLDVTYPSLDVVRVVQGQFVVSATATR